MKDKNINWGVAGMKETNIEKYFTKKEKNVDINIRYNGLIN